MASKWVDAATQTSICHLQCEHFRPVRPPSFFDYPELNLLGMTRDRPSTMTTTASSSYTADRNRSYRRFHEDERSRSCGGNYNRLRLRKVGSSDTECSLSGDSGPRKVGSSDDTECSLAGGDSGMYPENPAHRIYLPTTRLGGIIRSRFNSRGTSNDESIFHLGGDDEGDKSSSNRSMGGAAPRSEQMVRNETKREDLKSINAMDYIKTQRLMKARLNSLYHPRESSVSGTSESDSSVRDMSDAMDTPCWDDVDCHYREGARGQPVPLSAEPKMDGGWGQYFTTNKENPVATFYDPFYPGKVDKLGFASIQGGRTPTLFLQELAHLTSLLVAVALSTLRNDMEGDDVPFTVFEPGTPWPEVDPNKDELLKMNCFKSFSAKVRTYFWGKRTSAAKRTRYNSLRPFPVVCGVSNAESRFLQMSRGPYAKTQLCFNWLSEFIVREHLAGSLGTVGAPIVSRVLQYLGDGMVHYNHARKVMFIPFPFVHAQLSVLFIVVMIPAIPFLMDQYTTETWVGVALTFFTVVCLSGINEVGRELENPFRNGPNEVPLLTFQAQVNEVLMTTYSGFHPDSFWDGRDRDLGRAIKSKGGTDRSDVVVASSSTDQETPAVTDSESVLTVEMTAATGTDTISTCATIGSVPELSVNGATPTLLEPQHADCHGVANGDLVDAVVSDYVETSSSRNSCSNHPVDNTSSPLGVSDDSNEVAELKLVLMNQSKMIETLVSKVGTLYGMEENENIEEELTP